MWLGRGFFNSHAEETDPAKMPICVITPWRRGAKSRQLPHDDVKQRILKSGCRLVVTGTHDEQHGLEAKNYYCDSHVHIQVDHTGGATIVSHRLCEVQPTVLQRAAR